MTFNGKYISYGNYSAVVLVNGILYSVANADGKRYRIPLPGPWTVTSIEQTGSGYIIINTNIGPFIATGRVDELTWSEIQVINPPEALFCNALVATKNDIIIWVSDMYSIVNIDNVLEPLIQSVNTVHIGCPDAKLKINKLINVTYDTFNNSILMVDNNTNVHRAKHPDFKHSELLFKVTTVSEGDTTRTCKIYPHSNRFAIVIDNKLIIYETSIQTPHLIISEDAKDNPDYSSETVDYFIWFNTRGYLFNRGNKVIHILPSNESLEYIFEPHITNIQLISPTEVAIAYGSAILSIYNIETLKTETDTLNTQVSYLFGRPSGWGIVGTDTNIYTR